MRIIYKFQNSAQRDTFVRNIYDCGAYVRKSGDFSNGFRNLYDCGEEHVVELEPSYIKDARAIKMQADLLGGRLMN